MTITVIEEPAEEPVSLADAKEHLRVDGADEDGLIETFIKAARIAAERYCGRAFVSQKLLQQEDAFPDGGAPFKLRPQVIAVASIVYTDTAGASQTLPTSAYVVGKARGRITPKAGAGWPVAACQPGAVEIEYTAGFGAAADVPADIVTAIKIMVGHLYANRDAGASLPQLAKDLLAPHKVWSFG